MSVPAVRPGSSWWEQTVDSDARARVLARCPLFAGVADRELAGLADAAQARRYRRGQLLVAEGDPGDSLFVLVEGSLKAFSIRADGGELLLTVIGKYGVVGELSVVDGGARSASVSALTDVTVLRIPRAQVMAATLSSPELTRSLLDALAAMIRRLTGSAGDLALLDTPRRVAKMVLSGAAADGTTQTRLTQSEMAAAVGTSRQSVNAALKDFQRRGWLTVRPGEIELRDITALRRFVGG